MALPDCECVSGLSQPQKLDAIYCALAEIAAGQGGGGDVLASGTLTDNSLIIGQGGTTIAATTTGAGILTFLGTPSSANLRTALTDGTGTGAAVFATSPTLASATFSGNQLFAENASLGLDSALSADGTYTGIVISGTAGTALAFGDLIYLATADSRWELVDADSVTTAGAVLTGMCVLAAAADGSATSVLLYGNIRADSNFPALTIGAPVYASTTPGDIQVAQPSGTDDVIQVVGYALTADSILFNPSQNYITHT